MGANDGMGMAEHLCPNCGTILPVVIVTDDKREALFLMGYKTAEQVLRELAGYYPVESLIATLKGLGND